MSAIGAFILFSASVLIIFSGSRRGALMGVMIGTLFLTQSQTIEVAGLNIFGLRVIELVGFLRVLVRKEFSFSRMNSLDKWIVILYVYSTGVFLFRSTDGQFNQVGYATDALFSYFMCRGLVGTVEDFEQFLRDFLYLLAPFTLLVLVESVTHYNAFFAALGKSFSTVSEAWIRGGRIRCWGSFRHPSLLGTLGATFIPLYVGRALATGRLRISAVGIALCLLIIYASNSGGPVNCAATAGVGWMLWIFRRRMGAIRLAVIGFVIVMAFTMQAPIWYLPAKASSFTGGDGWHRSFLMDVAAKNFDKWWAMGMPITATANWFPYELEATGGADITNQFLAFAIGSGVMSMFLFIFVLVRAFSALGKAMAVLRESDPDNRPTEYMLWGLGAMLGAHVINWLGITYFDQTSMIWFMQLAAISNFTEQALFSTAPEMTEALPAVEEEDAAVSAP